jgi:hypothetical protein
MLFYVGFGGEIAVMPAIFAAIVRQRPLPLIQIKPRERRTRSSKKIWGTNRKVPSPPSDFKIVMVGRWRRSRLRSLQRNKNCWETGMGIEWIAVGIVFAAGALLRSQGLLDGPLDLLIFAILIFGFPAGVLVGYRWRDRASREHRGPPQPLAERERIARQTVR